MSFVSAILARPAAGRQFSCG